MSSTKVSLSDVYGAPGLPDGEELAHRLASSFETEPIQLSSIEDIPFLYGEFSRRLTGSRSAKARSFIRAVDQALPNIEIPPESITVMGDHHSSTGTHYLVQQTIDGVEVVGARCQLHADHADYLYAFTGRLLGDLKSRDPGPAPPTDKGEVIEAIRAHFGLPEETSIQVQRVIFPVDGRGEWAYEGRFVTYEPVVANICAYLRARDMWLMLSYNIASGKLCGEATVYPVNPARTPNVEVVRLDHLGPEPTDRLAGTVADVRPRFGKRCKHSCRDWRLDPNHAAFEEVQAYHHVCRAFDYFATLADEGMMRAAPFAPMQAVVRDFSEAYYLPDTGQLLFGEVDGRPAALSGEIVFHEYAHAVTDTISKLGRSPIANTPARAMSEGYSDYFACSTLNSPVIGDHLFGGEDVRDCSKQAVNFPPDFEGEEHRLGEVWAAVLWGIRDHCGASVADKLAIESVHFLDPLSEFGQGLAALIAADKRLYPTDGQLGRHEDIINQEYKKRCSSSY